MEFGRVPAYAIEQIDFTLPPDPIQNSKVLVPFEGKRNLYMGCPKWGVKSWVGKIYPEHTKERDYLPAYTRHFNSIELNATYYKVYEPATIRKWAVVASGKDFMFCPKMLQEITHAGSMYDKQMLTYAFLESIREFGDHLGPVFIQLSEYFGPDRRQELLDYLVTLPKDISFFLELRHPAWFADPEEPLYEQLAALGIGIVITDTPGHRYCAHMRLTNAKTIIRFVSNNLHPSDYTRIDDWIHRLKQWYAKGLETCYFFIHMHEEEFCPELALYFATQAEADLGMHIPKPVFVEKNTLF